MKKIIPKKIKLFIKKYFWKIYFHDMLFAKAKKKNVEFLESITDDIPTDFNMFTKDGEDGILLYLINMIGPVDKTFIDIGSNDCLNSNCANLAFHHGWAGVFIDGDAASLDRGKYIYSNFFKKEVNKFSFVQAIVKPDNVNKLLKGINAEVDLLAMDLDGNDYHIWKALEVINPKIVLVEVQIEKGNIDFIPEYANSFELYEDDNPKGASPLSMTKLANAKGYELVAANKGGYNLFFVRKDLVGDLEKLNVEG
jgi:hypothetical protein